MPACTYALTLVMYLWVLVELLPDHVITMSVNENKYF